MKSTNKIERLVKQNRYKASADAYDKTLGSFMQAVDNYKKQKSTSTDANISRTIMKTTKFAAAVIFIAVIIFLNQFRSSVVGTSIVWADVAEKLERMSSFTARSSRVLTEVGKDEPTFKCDVFKYFSPDYGYMEEQYIRYMDGQYINGELGMLNYGLFQEKLLIIVLPQTKQYYRFELNEEILSMMEYINPTNPDGIIKLFGSETCARLGRREIDGVIAEGFEVKDIKALSWVPKFLFQLGNVDIRLWVNPETLLPIEVEAEGLVGKGFLTGFKDFTGKEIVYDIEYDVEIDESIFDPNIPDDYILIEPANIAEKAGLIMLGILPFSAAMITYKQFKKRN